MVEMSVPEDMQEKLKNMSPEELQAFQKQQCLFCQIVYGKVPSKKIYSDEFCTALLDINPAAPDHILLFPNEHYAIMPLVPEDVIAHLSMVAKRLSQALLKGLQAQGVTIFVANGFAAGQKAQHFMIHLIPRKEGDGLQLQIPQKKMSEQDEQAIIARLKPAIMKKFGVAELPEEEKAEAPEEAKPESEKEPEEAEAKRAKKAPKKKKAEGVSLDDITKVLGGGG